MVEEMRFEIDGGKTISIKQQPDTIFRGEIEYAIAGPTDIIGAMEDGMWEESDLKNDELSWTSDFPCMMYFVLDLHIYLNKNNISYSMEEV